MRKVITINLNNNAFQIDEDGYEALRQYLESAERALTGNPDHAEIMADLEQAIADKCRLALGQYKTVVNSAEIGRILKEMGPVVTHEEAAPSSAGSTGGTTSAPDAPSRARRLYRIPDDQKWSFTGVCNGLAAYASVDVTWVRTAFILLTVFTGGFWFIAYGVLVFVLPVARSPEEVAVAHGQPFSAQELVDGFRKKKQDFRAARRARRNRNRDGHWFSAQPLAAGAAPRAPGAAARVAGGVMLPVVTLLSATWFAAMAITAIMVWHAYQPIGAHWPHGHWHVAELPRWLPLVAVLVIYGLLALPIAAGRRTALYYANGGRTHGWADVWSGLLWIALVAVLLLVAWTVLPQVRELMQNLFDWPRNSWTANWM